jgi:hypothetical protein
MLFVISSAIKAIAFHNVNFIIDLPEKCSLWAAGVLFSLAVSEQTQFGGRTSYSVSRKQSGTGIEVDYNVILPQQLEFTPKYVYLFVFSMMLWILTLLLCGQVSVWNTAGTGMVLWSSLVCAIAYVLAGANIGISLRALVEVVS